MQLKLNNLFTKANKEKYNKYLELIPDFKREKTQKFTTVVLTVIAIIILAIFAINPTLSTIANLQKQLDDAKFVTNKLEEKINDLSILQTKYNNIQDDLPIVYESIPKNSEVPKITGQIQSVAKDSGVFLTNLQATDITKSIKNDFFYYSFNLSIQGSYENILNFLDKLHSMQRITDAHNISIGQSTTEKGLLQLNIKGTAFFKK